MCDYSAFPNLCCAQSTPCNVTEDLRGTLYSIPEFQAVACDYQWTNTSGHILANKKEMITNLVLNRTVRTLLTLTCLDEVNYIRDCVSERIQHTAHCSTNCSRTPQPLKTEGSPHHYWSICIGISIMVLVLLGLVCRAFMRRDNQSNQSSTDDVEGGFQHKICCSN